MSISQACRWASAMASDLMEATKNQPKEDIPSIIKWRPPPVGFLKVVAARSTWYDAVPNVITAEAYACRDGVNLICNLNLNLKVILETDNIEFVTLWKTRNDRSSILPILHQIEELCRMCISFEVIHVKREANMAAHVTAKNASPLSAVNTWLYQVPEFPRPIFSMMLMLMLIMSNTRLLLFSKKKKKKAHASPGRLPRAWADAAELEPLEDAALVEGVAARHDGRSSPPCTPSS